MKTGYLKNALYNASKREIRCEHDIRYARGIIVGLVAGLMADGMEFIPALKLVKENLPNDCHPEVLPMSWRID